MSKTGKALINALTEAKKKGKEKGVKKTRKGVKYSHDTRLVNMTIVLLSLVVSCEYLTPFSFPQ